MPQITPHHRTVSKLASKNGKRMRYTFVGIKGLQLDCIPDGSPLGNRFWRVRYYIGEKEKIATLGTFNEGDREGYLTQSQATERAAEYRRTAKIDRLDPAEVGRTFDELYSDWLERHAKVKKRSWRADERLYKYHVKKRIGSSVVAEIKRRDILDVLDDVFKTSGVQANRVQSLISAVFGWALSEDMVEANPATGIVKRAKEIARDRVLSDAELRRWWHALDTNATPRVATVLRILLLTGLRLNEVCGMRWDELNGDVWEIPGSRTKSKLPHSCPLTPTVKALIDKVAIEGSPFVFAGIDRGKVIDKPISRFTPDYAYSCLAVKLGMIEPKANPRDKAKPNTTIHDLRRTMATNLAKFGVGEDLIDRVQGRMRRGGVGWVYNRHSYLSEKRAALEKWEAQLLGVVSRELT